MDEKKENQQPAKPELKGWRLYGKTLLLLGSTAGVYILSEGTQVVLMGVLLALLPFMHVSGLRLGVGLYGAVVFGRYAIKQVHDAWHGGAHTSMSAVSKSVKAALRQQAAGSPSGSRRDNSDQMAELQNLLSTLGAMSANRAPKPEDEPERVGQYL